MPLHTDEELDDLLTRDKGTDKANISLAGIETSSLIDLIRNLTSSNFNINNEEIGDQLIKLLLTVGGRYEGPNSQLYTEYPPNEMVSHPFKPEKLYFYYFKFDTNGALVSRVFSANINTNSNYTDSDHINEIKNDILDRVKSWVDKNPIGQQAIGKGDLKYINPDEVIWNRPCYLAFMLDEEDWSFYQHKNKNRTLHFSKQIIPRQIGDIQTTGESCSNKYKCFCNSEIIKLSKKHSILLVENRHISYATGEIRKYGDENPDVYKFDLIFRVSTSPKTHIDPQNRTAENEKKITMVIDPTGTNFGPP